MKNRKYTIEFKLQAIELAKSLGSMKKAANELGISDSNIHDWKKKLLVNQASLNGASSRESVSDELKRLKRENAEQKKVIQILKSAAAFFCQDQQK